MAASGYLFGKTDVLVECSENQRSNRFYTIVYVRRGAGIYSIGSSLKSLNSGDILILPPGVEYTFRSEDLGDKYNVNIDSFILRFDDTWLSNILIAFPSLSTIVLKIKESRRHLSVRGMKWMKLSSLFVELERCGPLDQPARILDILKLISSDDEMEIIKDYNDSDAISLEARKEKIDQYLACNFRRKVTLQNVADYVGMSRTYFSIFFKTHYKEGFSDYLNKKRLECAAALLAKTTLPISVIAEECGFNTVQYFTSTFKRLMGTSPTVYRRG